MPEWFWNPETECWTFTFEQQHPYPPSARKLFWRPKYFIDTIKVSVVKSLNGRDAELRACASAYATQIDFLKKAIATYLYGRPVNVYGGQVDCIEIVHPEEPTVDIRTIEIPDAQHPKRVHIFVDTGYPDPYFYYEVIFEDTIAIDALGGFQ